MGEMTVAHPPVLMARARAQVDRLNGPQRLVVFSICLGLVGAALWLLPLRDVQRVTIMGALSAAPNQSIRRPFRYSPT